MAFSRLSDRVRRVGNERLTPLRITVVYVVFGLFLLVVSDALWPMWIADAGLLRRIQGVKGAAEVFATGGVIYLLVGRMEGQLRRSKQRYRNLIETSPAPIGLFDEGGEIVWGNDALLDLLGLERREELLGRSIFEFVHPEDRDAVEDELARVVEGGEASGPTHVRLECDGGEGRHVRVSTAPGWHGDERVGQAVVVDVTELREVKDELEQEREFVQSALDELRDIFFVVDPGSGLERWNARLPAVTGYDDEELRSMEATDFVPESEERRVRDCREATLETGGSFLETTLVTNDGERRQYEIDSTRLDAPDGGVRGIVGIARDVTDRRRMERELRENERRYRTLVEMSPDPILVHADGEIVYANDATVDLVEGGGREELLGTHISRYLDPGEHRDAEETARRTQRGETAPTRYQRTVVTLEGDTRHVETTSRPIAYEGEPAVLTVVKDVTDRHRYEELLTTLHDWTRAMTRAGGPEEIVEIAVESGVELLGLEGAIFYEFDGGNELVPIAWSDAIGEDGLPEVERGEGCVWGAFVEGEERSVDDAGLPLRSGLALPVGNHGVLVGGGDEDSITTTRRKLANLLEGNLEAALDRAERQRDIRAQDRQLREQNEALEQLNRLNEIIREINRALIRSSTRSGIMESVCDQFASADPYAFAWVGGVEPEGAARPQHWSGMGREYVDWIGSEEPHAPLGELVDAAFRERSIQVAQDVLHDPEWGDHRSDALSQGYRSVAAVPIVKGETVDSVLVIHAEDPDVFDGREQAVLEELGGTVGYALRNVERTEAIQGEERTEVEVEIGDGRLFTNRIASELGAHIEFAGAIPGDGDVLRVFLRIEGATSDVEGALQGLKAVEGVQPLSVEEGSGLYQLTIHTPPLVDILEAHDGQLRALTAGGGTTTLVAVLPGEVRPFVEGLRAEYEGTELRARREDAEPVETRETFRDRVTGQLTERQYDALRTAHYGGFYEWPRATTSEELAGTRDIAASTFQYHLRAAERKVVSSILGPE